MNAGASLRTHPSRPTEMHAKIGSFGELVADRLSMTMKPTLA